MASRFEEALGVIGTFRRAGVIAPMRPDRYVKMAAAMRREGMVMTVGFAGAAQRCPDRPALVDELGTLTWRQLDERINALAAALQKLPSGQPKVIGIMCRNHRGFVESLVASNRIGSDVLLLNTSFAGPAMAEVVNREDVDAVIYDEEFTATVDRAMADKPDAPRILAWTDEPHDLTVEKLIADHAGQQFQRTGNKGKMILLTSGTTGSPKGAKQSGGGAGLGTLKAILDRTPWRARRTHCDRGADVSRLGLFPVDLRRIDGLHGDHSSQVRPGSDTGSHRPPPGDRPGSGAGDVRPHHGFAR